MSRWHDWAKMQWKMREQVVLKQTEGRVKEEAKDRLGLGCTEHSPQHNLMWPPQQSWVLGQVSRHCYMRVLTLSHVTTCPSHRERQCWHPPPGAPAPSRRFQLHPVFPLLPVLSSQLIRNNPLNLDVRKVTVRVRARKAARGTEERSLQEAQNLKGCLQEEETLVFSMPQKAELGPITRNHRETTFQWLDE